MIAQFFSIKPPSEWKTGSKHRYILLGKPQAVLHIVYHEKEQLYEYIYK